MWNSSKLLILFGQVEDGITSFRDLGCIVTLIENVSNRTAIVKTSKREID